MNQHCANFYLLNPYPDELFYSTLARTCRVYGFPRGLYVDKIYHHHKRWRLTLPSDLREFSKPFDVLDGCVANYYVSTYSLEEAIAFYKRILGREKVFTRFFVEIPSFKKKKLYYCPTCLIEDNEKFGIPYFHLSHQLGGVYACPYHGTKLIKFDDPFWSTLPVLSLENYQKPVAAEEFDVNFSKWALNFKNFYQEYLLAVYHARIKELDPQLFKTKYFYHELENFYGRDFMEYYGCREKMQRRDRKNLTNVLFVNRHFIHPFYHYLVWNFLGLDYSNFKNPINATLFKRLLYPVEVPEEGFNLIENKSNHFIKFYQSNSLTYYQLNPMSPDLEENILNMKIPLFKETP